jgi:hypothetical protein
VIAITFITTLQNIFVLPYTKDTGREIMSAMNTPKATSMRAIVIFMDGSESRTDWYNNNNPRLIDSMLELGRAPKAVAAIRWESAATGSATNSSNRNPTI